MEKMDYGSFQEELLKRLKEAYGEDAEVEKVKIEKNNGASYEGIRVQRPGSGASPVIRTGMLYEKYADGTAGMEECVRAALIKEEGSRCTEEMERLIDCISDWEAVKGEVYPLLLSTEANRVQAERLASMPFLDLMVVYAVRKCMGEGYSIIRISREMLEAYGITVRQLHEQAVENLRGDGCRFYDIREVTGEKEEEDGGGTPEMYVLTNRGHLYGAAGLLDAEAVREFAAGRDFFILPSSVHETLFLPIEKTEDKGWLDLMIQRINQAEIREEDRLSGHCYVYDAKAGEIRMHV